MSVCISSKGEYSSHSRSKEPEMVGDEFTCTDCYVFDEASAVTEISRLRDLVSRLQSGKKKR